MLPLVTGLLLIFYLSTESIYILLIVFFACIPQTFHAIGLNSSIKGICYNIYTPIEFLLFFVVFYKHVSTAYNVQLMRLTFIVYILFSIFFVVNNKLTIFIAPWVALNGLIYTAWILAIFLEQYKFNDGKNLDFSSPFFWYATGLFFYAPCTAMIFSMWKYVVSTTISLKIVHEIFNINMYIFFAIGFLKNKTIKSETKTNAGIATY